MTTPRHTGVAEPPPAPPVLNRDWRFHTGMAALILSLIMPLFAFLVPLVGLTVAESAVAVGVLIAGGPEVVGLLGVALLGRNAFQYFSYKIRTKLRQIVLTTRVSKSRYYCGLTITLTSLLLIYVYGHFPDWLPLGEMRFYIVAAAGVSFLLGMFLMGGEFWDKFRRLFLWEGKP
ncbi:MAG: hypothetical protein ACT4QB_13640 [Gammaproteobacteria bacterium]